MKQVSFIIGVLIALVLILGVMVYDQEERIGELEKCVALQAEIDKAFIDHMKGEVKPPVFKQRLPRTPDAIMVGL